MTDVAALRDIGAVWERNFCLLAAAYGKEFTPHQVVRKEGAACSYWKDDHGVWRRQLLPDVVLWSAPGEHHEIKHKERMRNGCYGYEVYRLRELIRFANTTQQTVYYTIHDWRLAGASGSAESTENRIEHWLCADVKMLSCSHDGEFTGPSIVGGIRKPDVRQFYWRADDYFRPLAELWTG